MPREPLDNRSLMKRTLITVGAMVGGSIVLVGTLTFVASSVVGRAVSAPDSSTSTSGAHTVSPVKPSPLGAAKTR
jgi:hypothetical protein